MTKAAAIAATTLAILGAGAVGASAQTLSLNEVRDLFPGTYVVTVLGTYEVHVRMKSNGTLAGTSNGENDTGRWSIESGKLCIQWNTWNGGRKDCSTLQRDGSRVQGRGFWFNAA
jgi:hypothetical protein